MVAGVGHLPATPSPGALEAANALGPAFFRLPGTLGASNAPGGVAMGPGMSAGGHDLASQREFVTFDAYKAL